MAIVEVKGNLIEWAREGKLGVIAHQANCMNNFGKGLARQLRLAFPALYRADLMTVRADQSKLGRTSIAELMNHPSGEPNLSLYGVNLYGQYSTNAVEKRTDYRALSRALGEMSGMSLVKGKVIGLPRLGCGNGRGDWAKVKQLIEQWLVPIADTIYVFELPEAEEF